MIKKLDFWNVTRLSMDTHYIKMCETSLYLPDYTKVSREDIAVIRSIDQLIPILNPYCTIKSRIKNRNSRLEIIFKKN